MANLYRNLFTHAGTGYFTAAGLVARLPLPMTGIGIITLLSQQGSGYTLAGKVVDGSSARMGFSVALAGGGVVLFMALWCYATLQNQARRSRTTGVKS